MAKITAAQVKESRGRTGAGMMDSEKALVEAEGDTEGAIDILRENGVIKAAKKSGRIAAESLAEFASEGNIAALVEINSETDFVASNDKFIDLVNDITRAVLAAKPKNMEEALNAPLADGTIESVTTNLTAIIGEEITFRRFKLINKNDDEVFGTYKYDGGAIVALVTLKGGNEEAARNIAMHVTAINPEYLNKDSVPTDELECQKVVFTKETENEGKSANIVPRIVEGRVNKYLSGICLVGQAYAKDSDMTAEAYVKSQNVTVVNSERSEAGEGIEKKQEDFAAEVREQMK